MKYFWETISSWAYWRYVLFSINGIQSVLVVFGGIFLFVEALDFFGLYSRDQYANYAVLLILGLSVLISTVTRRPITSITLGFPQRDFDVEIRIGDLFDSPGAVMISSNTDFEADVASGKIAPESLQGQFTARYFTGNQGELIEEIEGYLASESIKVPAEYGTTIPIHTHGKTFYFCAMASLNEKGTASTTVQYVKEALNGLWTHVREAGELQELAVPLVGTGRGRVKTTRKKMIEIIAQSFVDASNDAVFSSRLVIVVRPEDAKQFQVNLWDIKDHLRHSVES